jgi:iron complex transport system permease protein
MRLAGLGLAALFLASLLVGGAGVGVPEWPIVWTLRLPRSGLALLIGAGLGLSGAVLQGALRNPLADPGLLGVAGSAAVGGVIAFYWGLAARSALALPLAGMIGAGIGCALLLRLAGRVPTGAGLVIAGVALSAFAAALLALLLALAPNPFALAEVAFWLMGSVEDRSLVHLAVAAPPTALGCAVLLRLGPGLDALSLGEATAATLGRPAARTLRLAALGTALAVGPGAAVAGGIGFVGLAVPHLLRPWLGERPGALLGASALGGAALLLLADVLARAAPLILPLNQEPRLGVLTALLGAPILVAASRRVTA